MLCMRDDCSYRGAASVLDRIIAIADHRLGAEGIAEAAAVEIVIGLGRPASGLPVNMEAILHIMHFISRYQHLIFKVHRGSTARPNC